MARAPKKLYKITGTLEVDYYFFCRAHSAEEAEAMGEQAAENGAWTADNGVGAGDWQPGAPHEVSEDALGPDDSPSEAPQFTVSGSHGTLIVDLKTGLVDAHEDACRDVCEGCYGLIERIDLACQPREGESFDILTVGYWLEDGTYEPPLCPKHRDGGPHECAFDGVEQEAS